jgi:hypothetical protein
MGVLISLDGGLIPIYGNPYDSKQIVSFEELLMSQVIQQEALTRLFAEKGIFTKGEFLEMVKAVNIEMEKRKRGH